MQRRLVMGGVGLAMALAFAGTAQAQTLGADVALNSAYFWRGLSLSNKPVVEPDLYLTFGHKVTFTAGGWANIELGKYDGDTDISEGGGTSSLNLTEFDWWGEFGIPAGLATLTVGATGYIYPNDGGFTKESNTTEIYGKIGLGVPLSPKLAVWYDVDKIKGVYAEASVGVPVHLTPVLPLQLGVLAGFSAGQGCKPDAAGVCDPNVAANFHDDGLTHIDLSASLPITAGPISITPNVHGIIGNDEWVKITKLDPTAADGVKKSSFKVVVGATISWAHAFGAAKAE